MNSIKCELQTEDVDALSQDPDVTNHINRQFRHALAIQLLGQHQGCPGQPVDAFETETLIAAASTNAAERFSSMINLSDAHPDFRRHIGRAIFAALAKTVDENVKNALFAMDVDELQATIDAIEYEERIIDYRKNEGLMAEVGQHVRWHAARALLDLRLAEPKTRTNPRTVDTVFANALIDAAGTFHVAHPLSSEDDPWERWVENQKLFIELATPRLTEFASDLFTKQKGALAFDIARCGLSMLNDPATAPKLPPAYIERIVHDGGRALLGARQHDIPWDRLPPFQRDGLRVF